MNIVTYDKNLVPEKATNNSLCYDLKAAEDVIIKPKEVKIIKLWIKTDFAWFLFARSSLVLKKWLILWNWVWVIDEDYRNEVWMIVYNIKDEDVKIFYAERIWQMYIINGKPNIIVDKNIYDNWENINKSERKWWFWSTEWYMYNPSNFTDSDVTDNLWFDSF